MRPYISGACVKAAGARKFSVYMRHLLQIPKVRVMSALIIVILAISGNDHARTSEFSTGAVRAVKTDTCIHMDRQTTVT